MMKTTLKSLLLGTITSVAVVTAGAEAGPIVLTGEFLDGNFGPDTIVNYNETDHGALTSIWFDLNYSTLLTGGGDAWGCELDITLDHPNSANNLFIGGSDFGFDCSFTTTDYIANIDWTALPADWSTADISGDWIVNLNSGGFGDAKFNAVSEITFHTSSIPEPATIALFGTGLLGLAVFRRRRSARKT